MSRSARPVDDYYDPVQKQYVLSGDPLEKGRKKKSRKRYRRHKFAYWVPEQTPLQYIPLEEL